MASYLVISHKQAINVKKAQARRIQSIRAQETRMVNAARGVNMTMSEAGLMLPHLALSPDSRTHSNIQMADAEHIGVHSPRAFGAEKIWRTSKIAKIGVENMNVARAKVNRHDSVGKSYNGGCNDIPTNLVTLPKSSLASMLILWLLGYPSKPWTSTISCHVSPLLQRTLIAQGWLGSEGQTTQTETPHAMSPTGGCSIYRGF